MQHFLNKNGKKMDKFREYVFTDHFVDKIRSSWFQLDPSRRETWDFKQANGKYQTREMFGQWRNGFQFLARYPTTELFFAYKECVYKKSMGLLLGQKDVEKNIIVQTTSTHPGIKQEAVSYWLL